MKKRCYIYTRVSTAAQIEGYSLEAQTERLKEYATYRELEVAGEYCDAGKSGRSIKGRPAFQQMLDDIVDGKDGISFVLVFILQNAEFCIQQICQVIGRRSVVGMCGR